MKKVGSSYYEVSKVIMREKDQLTFSFCQYFMDCIFVFYKNTNKLGSVRLVECFFCYYYHYFNN